MKTVLFDLDGTLLPMDQPAFIRAFLAGLHKKLVTLGVEAELAKRAMKAALPAVLENDGQKSGREAFYDALSLVLGYDAYRYEAPLCAFYGAEFSEAAVHCQPSEWARRILALVKERGARAVLATSPFFPHEGTYARIAWAGLTPEDFALITTYENTRFCKPSLGYYRDLLAALDTAAENCMMVGNDVTDDMVAGELGIATFLVTDCLINREGADISRFAHGSYPEAYAAIEKFLDN